MLNSGLENFAGAPVPSKVLFHSAAQGVSLAGDLYAPDNRPSALPAFVIIGPMTYQKEQAPTAYAQRLAASGFAALAFDCRYRGESGGSPRAFENPFDKVQDINDAVTYLRSRPDIDPDRIYGLAICQGSSEMLHAVADNGGIKAGITLAGHYRDHEGDLEWLTQEGYSARRANGERARTIYQQRGETIYVAAVDETDLNVGMPGKFVWDWYHVWAERGLWENKYALMSDAELLSFESISAARRQHKPYLMIHSDNSFLPAAARRHFEAMPSDAKTLLWEGETPHFHYYDNAEVLDRSVATITDWVASLDQHAAS